MVKNIYQKIRLVFLRFLKVEKIESKLFNISVFFGAITCFLAFTINIVTHSPLWINVILVVTGTLFSLFFYLSVFKNITRPLVLPFQVLVTVVLSINWYFFQGIEGSTPVFFFLAMFILIFSESDSKYWRILIVFVLVSIGLTATNNFYPDWGVHYSNDISRKLDLSFSFIISLFLLGYATIILKKNYDLERAKAEKRKDTLYQTLFENANDAIFTLDRDVFKNCNQMALKMFGCEKKEDIIGHSPWEFSPETQPGGRNSQKLAIETIHALETGGAQRFFWDHIKKDGTLFHTEVSLNRIDLEDTFLLQSIVRDITKQKKEEDLIVKGSLLKQKLLDTSDHTRQLKLIVDGVVEILGADFARIWLIGKADHCTQGCPHAIVSEGADVCVGQTNCLHLKVSSGRYTRTDGKYSRIPFGSYKIGRIASGEYPGFMSNDVTNDVLNDPSIHDKEWAKALNLVAFAGYQLQSETGEPMGVFGLFRQREIQPYEEKFIEELSQVASQVVQAGFAQEVLRESEERYRGLFNGIPIGLYRTSANGQILDANPALVEMLGYPDRDTLLAVTVEDGYEDKAKHLEWKSRMEKEGFISSFETSWKRYDGTLILVLESSRAVFSADGEILYYEGAVEDITERKRTEKALKISESRLQYSIESGEIGLWEMDMSNNKIWRTLRYDRIFGYDTLLPEWTYDMFLDHLMDEDRGRVNQKFIKAITNSITWNFECRIKRKDGALRWIWMKGDPENNEYNEISKMFGVVQDITERKRIEEELKENEARLLELNSTKDKLFAIIAHDLRGPFNNILGFSSLLYENVRSFDIDKTEKILGFLNASAMHNFFLLDSLLSWSKSQTGQLEFKPEKIDLQEIVQGIIGFLKSSAHLKNISLSYSSTNLVAPYADLNMLQTILRNLISNSIKFTNPGGFVKVCAVSNHYMVEVIVEDNGVGMTKEKQDKLFRTDSIVTTIGTANERGSGLGLIFCQEFVEKHGGKIWVESEPDKGSKFHFTLPKERNGIKKKKAVKSNLYKAKI